MSVPMEVRVSSVLLALFLTAPNALEAQSLLGTRGLGLPLEAVDARSRALGSEGVGLLGGNLNPTDLASAAGLLIPTVNFTLQPHWGRGSLDGESIRSQGTRFPLLGIAYPVADLGGMVTLTFGSYMDQRWEMEEKGTVELESVTTPVTNIFTSDGGIAELRLGWAQRVGNSLSLSVSAGLHTGSVTRTYLRSFDSLAVSSPEIIPFTDGGKWTFSGPTGSIGAVWDPVQFLRLGGSLSWSGDMDAEPSKETQGEAAKYSLPTVFRVGASGILTPTLSLTLGMSYADWKANEGGLDSETAAGGVWSFGGGLELLTTGLGGRTLPLRLGMRRSDLPFLFDGAKPRESIFSGGLGLNLTQADQFILAGVDLAVERGTRKAGALKEDFWRASVTFKVSGW
jgi:hypothetical protein